MPDIDLFEERVKVVVQTSRVDAGFPVLVESKLLVLISLFVVPVDFDARHLHPVMSSLNCIRGLMSSTDFLIS